MFFCKLQQSVHGQHPLAGQRLLPFDLEPEQTFRQQKRVQKLQMESSLQDTFLQKLFTGFLDSEEIVAFIIPTAGQPLRESLATHATEVLSCISYPKS